jgi:hypothetical protein
MASRTLSGLPRAAPQGCHGHAGLPEDGGHVGHRTGQGQVGPAPGQRPERGRRSGTGQHEPRPGHRLPDRGPHVADQPPGGVHVGEIAKVAGERHQAGLPVPEPRARRKRRQVHAVGHDRDRTVSQGLAVHAGRHHPDGHGRRQAGLQPGTAVEPLARRSEPRTERSRPARRRRFRDWASTRSSTTGSAGSGPRPAATRTSWTWTRSKRRRRSAPCIAARSRWSRYKPAWRDWPTSPIRGHPQRLHPGRSGTRMTSSQAPARGGGIAPLPRR